MVEHMTLSTGTLLQGGKYRIEKVLGQGGFGVTMTVGTASSQKALVGKFKNKFIREAQMIAGMDHPNIVRVTDVFEEYEPLFISEVLLPQS